MKRPRRASRCAMLLAAGLILAGPASGQAYRGPIIDVHLHSRTAEELASRRRGSARPESAASNRPADRAARVIDERVASQLGRRSLGELPVLDVPGHFKATLAEMDRHRIRLAMVSGDDAESVRWSVAQPGRFLVGYSPDGPGDLAAVRRMRAAGQLDCIGEWGAQYAGLLPGDPSLAPLWAWAEAEDVPVAYHLHPGPPGAPALGAPIRPSHGRPLHLEPLLDRHPRLRLYIMHAGWPFADEMIALLWAYPQVYIDIAVINWTLSRPMFHAYLKRFVDAGFTDRIMFGSDQMEWPEAIGRAIEAVDSADFLGLEQKRAIFHDNAVRFFRLPAAKD